MYGAYWNHLIELKTLNDISPDRELITLRLYEEIITRSMEYAKYLREDGITKEEITAVYQGIATEIDSMEKNATEKVYEEIKGLRTLMKQADQMIRSSYKEDK